MAAMQPGQRNACRIGNAGSAQAPDECSFCATIYAPAARRPSALDCSELSRRYKSAHINLAVIECSLSRCQNNTLSSPSSHPFSTILRLSSQSPTLDVPPFPAASSTPLSLTVTTLYLPFAKKSLESLRPIRLLEVYLPARESPRDRAPRQLCDRLILPLLPSSSLRPVHCATSPNSGSGVSPIR